MSSSAKIGAFTLVVLAVLAALVLKIEDIPIGKKARTGSVEVQFRDVAGLDDKSAVRIAGVRVGRVDGIQLLPDGTAVARLALDPEVELRQGAYGQIRNMGLLGDKYVELFPGPADAPRLGPGARISGQVPTGFDDLTKLAADIGKDVKELTGALAGSLGGETGEKKINRIVDNIGALAEALRQLVESNRQNVDVTLANLREFSGQMRETLARLDRILDENRIGVKQSVSNLDEVTGKLKTTVDNLNSITGKIDSGKGTIGKLVNDDETSKNLNEALASVKTGIDSFNTTLTRINRIQLDLGFYGEYMSRTDGWRGVFRVDVVPRENKFYRLELVGIPNGRRLEDNFTYTTTVDGVKGSTVSTNVISYRDEFGVTAQLGYRFNNTILRAGLIETRGGAAIDQLWLKDKLQLSAEAWDFGRSTGNAQVKLFGQWQSRGSLFVRAGVDDSLNPARRSFFVGAGLRWRDEDIKTLLPAASSFLH